MEQGILRGLVAAAFTPFQENGDLALGQVSKLAQLYRTNRLNGVFINGTTGEFASLSLSEQKDIIEAWQEEKDEHLKVGVMLGGTCLKDMQELARFSAEQGMDAAALLSPYYFRPANIGVLVDFVAAIAETVPDLPFYYYHIPSMSRGDFLMREFLPLAAARIPNLVGIKYSHYNIMDFQAACLFEDGRYDMLWGTDEALLSGLVAGASGAIGSTYNYAAPLYHDLLDCYEKKELDKARMLQGKSVAMVELLFKYGGAGVGKAIMNLIGLDCGEVRTPLSGLSLMEHKALEKELKAIDFFDFCCQL
ncbi:MAG: dihydrodipicolinate synthase family protein [Saprospiraceae bacterium]